MHVECMLSACWVRVGGNAFLARMCAGYPCMKYLQWQLTVGEHVVPDTSWRVGSDGTVPLSPSLCQTCCRHMCVVIIP